MNLAREKQIRTAFARSWKDLRPVVSGHRLTGQESIVFKRALSLWFRRYAARYGNEDVPMEELAGSLRQVARQWVGNYHREDPGVPVADSVEVY